MPEEHSSGINDARMRSRESVSDIVNCSAREREDRSSDKEDPNESFKHAH